MAALHELAECYRGDTDECSFDCSSINLGALMKEMRAKSLDLKLETPLLGSSIVAAMDTARSIRSPQWVCPRRHYGRRISPCNLQTRIQSMMDGLQEGIGGFTLDDFDGRRSLPHPRS